MPSVSANGMSTLTLLASESVLAGLNVTVGGDCSIDGLNYEWKQISVQERSSGVTCAGFYEIKTTQTLYMTANSLQGECEYEFVCNVTSYIKLECSNQFIIFENFEGVIVYIWKGYYIKMWIFFWKQRVLQSKFSCNTSKNKYSAQSSPKILKVGKSWVNNHFKNHCLQKTTNTFTPPPPPQKKKWPFFFWGGGIIPFRGGGGGGGV